LSTAVPAAVHTPTSRVAAPGRALTTRALDFWLLGGASLVVWLVMFAADRFRADPSVERQLQNLAVAALALSLLVNYPHFLASYKLAYSRGRSFALTHWWQLIVVPVGLTALFAAAFALYDVPVANVELISGARQAVDGWGTNANVLTGPRVGDVLFTAAFHLMIFTIGWHYTKQVFGCMVVYAQFDGYALTPAQRELTRRALFTIWAMSIVDFNLAGAWRRFGDFSYASFDLPDAAGPLSQIAVAAAVGLVGYKVFYANYRASGQRPSVNMLVPVAALCVWWLPLTRQEEFFYVLAPLFHLLQYLAFVYKVEDTRLRGAPHRYLRGLAVAAGVVLAGWLAFEAVPNAMDARLGTFDAWRVSFFVMAAWLFLNIHHYFIDNVIWRFKDPRVRAYLLA
jgi:hypothetical protein